ncbi:hypothetical protein KZZ52_30880 [Dactylosporangium sp. AC04546]|uniref:hypothetical protein n=1 Tax=Dactylosporangium sp. AC04546 TaxID=2862460 RepID=UPI001EDE195B|nr:hypothetical protein [Dactylosporangium sp. AC04546]WVK78399.1 hypothetical protein KZZ52_30880 [Dactylosporangium sp. AC04546]
MAGDQPDGVVYVVTDLAGAHLVSLDEPAMLGPAQRTAHEGAVHLTLFDPSPVAAAHRHEPAELGRDRALMAAAGVLAVVASLVVSFAVNGWVAAPLAVTALVALAVAYDRHATRSRRRWSARQRTLLGGAEATQFSRALAATRTISAAWPRIGPLVQVETPRRELSAALWELADRLHTHAQLREELSSLHRARSDLRPSAAVRAELTDRIDRVEAALEPLRTDTRHRVASLERLARQCAELARDEQAAATAREAIRRADRSLGLLPAHSPPPPAEQEFAERVRWIITAYRDLSGLG